MTRGLTALATPDTTAQDRARAVARAGHKGATMTAAVDQGTAKLDIYDVIDPFFGVSATDVVAALDNLDTADHDTLEVHLNSPGGDVFEGITIANRLRQHDARVTVVVDGLAASIASVIALAGDEIVMAPGAQMMIHDASGMCIGNAATMSKMAEDLDKVSGNLAAQYADRAGGEAAQWRDLMHAETWFNDSEAVEAGLADRVLAPENADPGKAAAALAQWPLERLFAHAGREAAPKPRIPATSAGPLRPTASAVGSTAPAAQNASGDTTQERSSDLMTEDELTDLRNKLGVADDADGSTILQALDEALEERADAPQDTTPTTPEGVTQIDAQVLEQLRADAELGRAAHERQQESEREKAVQDALRQGRISAARADYWRDYLKADPEGGREVLASLEAGGAVNVSERGHAGDTELDSENAKLLALLQPTTNEEDA